MAESSNLMTVIFLGAGLLHCAISMPMISRKLPPNPFYGVRTRRTMEDPELWYDVNEYGGRLLFRVGVVTIVGTVVLRLLPLPVELFPLGAALVMLIPLMVSLNKIFAYLREHP